MVCKQKYEFRPEFRGFINLSMLFGSYQLEVWPFL